jgi:hypothetical protein
MFEFDMIYKFDELPISGGRLVSGMASVGYGRDDWAVEEITVTAIAEPGQDWQDGDGDIDETSPLWAPIVKALDEQREAERIEEKISEALVEEKISERIDNAEHSTLSRRQQGTSK